MWQGSCSSIQGWFVSSRLFTMFSRYFCGCRMMKVYTWGYKVATVSQILMTWVPWESSRIAGVILVILLLFGLCMASSLGLGSEGVGGLMLKNFSKPDKAEVCVIPWYTNRICLLFCEIFFLNPGLGGQGKQLTRGGSEWHWVTELLPNFFVCYCWSYGGFPSPTGW